MPHDLFPGAHLVTPRLGYRHHGIYAGDGRVIHYGGMHRWLSRRPVEEVSLATFTHGRGLAVKAWTSPRFSGREIVARARTRLGEDRYRLLSNNCEHFVEWCIGGRSRSPQVEAWLAPLHRLAARAQRQRTVVTSLANT